MKIYLNILINITIFSLLTSCVHIKTTSYSHYPEVPATQITKRKMENIRVALIMHTKRVEISSAGHILIYNMNTQKIMLKMRLSEETQVLYQEGQLRIGPYLLDFNRIRIVPESMNEYLKVNQNYYRGQIEFITNKETSSFTVINYVAIEDYLKGVIPNEVSPHWPIETLKTQAVAARTFAFYKMSGRLTADYDLDATPNSQVYKGVKSEQADTNQAVEETKGIVAVYNGKLIPAFYHSNCGGSTADVQDVWGGDAPYLKGVVCGFCSQEPHGKWKAELPKVEIEARLRKHNISIHNLSSIDVQSRDPSGRIKVMVIRHAQGSEKVKAAAFRMIMGAETIRSTNFYTQDNGRTILFYGQGWGHGVGLCQEGAYGMATNGYTFQQILQHYYPGIQLQYFRY